MCLFGYHCSPLAVTNVLDVLLSPLAVTNVLDVLPMFPLLSQMCPLVYVLYCTVQFIP